MSFLIRDFERIFNSKLDIFKNSQIDKKIDIFYNCHSLIYLLKKNKITENILNELVNYSKSYISELTEAFGKILKLNIDLIEKCEQIFGIKEKLKILIKLINSLEIEEVKKELKKLEKTIEYEIMKEIENWGNFINSHFNMNKKNSSILWNLRFQVEINNIIILKSFPEGEQFFKESNYICDVLEKLKIDQVSENLQFIKNISSESKNNYTLFIKIQKILATYNSFCYRIYSCYYKEFVQSEEYMKFVKTLNKKMINNSEIFFSSYQELENFKNDLEVNISQLNKEIDLLTSLQSSHLDIFRILENLNFFSNSVSWKKYLLEMYKVNKKNINDFLNKKLFHLISFSCEKDIDAIIQESFENGIDIVFKLDENSVISIKNENYLFDKFFEKIQINVDILKNFKFTYLDKKLKKIVTNLEKNKIDPIKEKLEIKKETLLTQINKEEVYFNFLKKVKNLEEIHNDEEDITLLQDSVFYVKNLSQDLKKMKNKSKSDYFFLDFTELNIELENRLNNILELSIDLLYSYIQKKWKEIIMFVKNKEIIFEKNNSEDDLENIILFESLQEEISKIKKKITKINTLKEFLLINVEDFFDDNIYQKEIWDDFLYKFEIQNDKINLSKNKYKEKIEIDFKKHEEKLTKIKTLYKKLVSCQASKKFDKKFVYYLTTFDKKWKKFLKENEQLIKNFHCFKTDFKDFNDFQKKITEYYKGIDDWKIFLEFNQNLNDYKIKKWTEIKPFIKNFEDFLENYKNLTQLKNEVKTIILETIKRISFNFEMLQILASDSMDNYNWLKIKQLLKILKNDELILFGELLEINIENYKEEIKVIWLECKNQKVLKEALDEINQFILTTNLNFKEFKKIDISKKIYLVSDFEDTIDKLNEKLVIIQNIKNSPFIKRYLNLAEETFCKINGLEQILDSLKNVQSRWIYLYSLMNNPCLKNHKNKEFIKFSSVSKQIVKILDSLFQKKNILALYNYSNLKETLEKITETLEACQKNLNSFLEEKRSLFPRLYFLGDENLMELIGNLRNEEIQNRVLKKIFCAFKLFNYDPQSFEIKGGISDIGEEFVFDQPIKVHQDKCEEVLLNMEYKIKISLKKRLEDLYKFEKLLINKIDSELEQITSLIQWIKFFDDLEENVSKKEIKKTILKNIEFLSSYRNESEILMFKRKSLLIDSIYQNDIIDKLIKLEGKDNFYYFSLFKYDYEMPDKYSSEDKEDLGIKIGYFYSDYKFEYLGNIEKLIFTPLTERCFFVLTQSINFGFGGNPFGPAGTGKTETVKLLGNKLGHIVLVFNCDENIEFSNICRILKGLVGSGSWGCFDEFNRLELTQLSAISHVIQTIQLALKINKKTKDKTKINIIGDDIYLNIFANIFITMNPVSKEYGGRNELPDSLKSLFRPIAMTVPDSVKIVEVMLLSEGFSFTFTTKAAVWIVNFMNSAKNIFNSNKIYDWGLRSLKSIILQAGSKREKLKNEEISEESYFLIDSLKENLTHKICEQELPLLKEMLDKFIPSLVPKEEIKKIDNENDFKNSIKKAMKELSLHSIISQIDLVAYIYSILTKKTGICLVGDSQGGKTTILKILVKTLELEKFKVFIYKINPKSVKKENLFGHYDKDGMEFLDGIFVNILRNCLFTLNEVQMKNNSEKSESKLKFFIVFDGDVDPTWIEALNSALDDNKLFTLPNGERFLLPNELNLFFECENLNFATPATISRLSIISIPFTNQKYNNDDVYFEEDQKTNPNSNFKKKITFLHNTISHFKKNILVNSENEFVDPNFNQTTNVFSFFCNKLTSAENLILFFENNFEFKNNKIFPKLKEKVVLLIYDIERIKADIYETKSLEQLLYDICDNGGFYKEKKFFNLIDINFVVMTKESVRINNRLRNRLIRVVNKSDWNYQNQYLDKKVEDSVYCLIKLQNPLNFAFEKNKEKYLDVISLASSKIAGKKIESKKSFFIKKKNAFSNMISEFYFKNWENNIFYSERLRKFLSILDDSVNKFVLYVGNSGTNRKEFIKFVASAKNYDCFFIESFQQNLHQNIFLKELKKLWALLKEKKVLFIIEEVQLENEAFLEILDNLVNIKNFGFYKNELKYFLQILDDEEKFENALKGIWDNLKIVVIWKNESTKKFEKIMKNYSFFQRNFLTLMDIDFSKDFINSFIDINFEELNENLKKIVKTLIQEFGVKKVNYFLDYFVKLKARKGEELESEMKKYKRGLEMIKNTELGICEFSEAIFQEKKNLQLKQKEIDEKLSDITKTSFEVSEEKEKSEKFKKSLQLEKNVLDEKQQLIKEHLDKVTPLLEQAKEDIKSLSKSNLDEMRSYKFPPEPVVDIFTVIMKLLNEFDVSLSNMKKFLGKRTVIEKITEIDPKKIKPVLLKEIENFISKKKSSFEYSSVIRCSRAAASIAQFVKAMVNYVKTFHDIKPIQDELETLNKNLKISQTQFESTEQKLKNLISFQKKLRENLKESSLRIKELAEEIDKKESMLDKSKELIKKLAEENERWSVMIDLYKNDQDIYIDKLFIICYYLAFLSDKEQNYAKNKLSQFIEKYFKNLEEFDFSKFLEKIDFSFVDKKLLENKNHFFLMNLIAIDLVDTPKIIIDSDNQLLDLMKTNKEIEFVDYLDNKLFFKIDISMKFGKTILISNLPNKLEYNLYLYTLQRVKIIDGRYFISIGERTVEKNNNFKIYLFTKEIDFCNNYDNLKIVSFFTSQDYLKEEILRSLVLWREPQLEIENQSILKKKKETEEEVKTLEKNLLENLSTQKGNLIENDQLMKSLEEIKSQSKELVVHLEKINLLKTEIEMKQKKFFIAAEKISQMFLLITSLYKLNPLYYFSLISLKKFMLNYFSQYKKDFETSLFLKDFTENLISYVIKGLLEEDILVFILKLIFDIGLFDRPKNEIKTFENFLDFERNDTLYNVLFKKHRKLYKTGKEINFPYYFPKENIDLARMMKKPYNSVIDAIEKASNLQTLEKFSIGFSELENIVLNFLCFPEKIIPSLYTYINKKISPDCINRSGNINEILDFCFDINIPLLIILSQSNNPSKFIMDFCLEKNIILEQIMIGEKSSEDILNFVKNNIKKKCIIFVQNIHLVPTLSEEILNIFNSEEKNPDCRLFITSQYINNFTFSFLGSCYKFIVERRPSIKNSFEINERLQKNEKHQKLIVSNYSFLHSLIEERANYIPRGWNKNYEFNNNDLLSGSDIINISAKNNRIEFLEKFIRNFIYTAKIDNKLDVEVVKTYFKIYFGEKDLSLLNSNEIENKYDSIEPELFGLDKSTTADSHIEKLDLFFKKLDILNQINKSTEINPLKENLEMFVNKWTNTKSQLILKNQKLNFDSNEFLIKNFISQEIKIFTNLVKIIENIFENLKVYNEKKIKLKEIPYHKELLNLNTPSHLLSIWGNKKKFNDYFNDFLELKNKLDINIEKIKEKENDYILSGFLNPKKFLNTLSLIEATKSSEIQNIILMATPIQYHQNKNVISLKNLYLQGIDLDENNCSLHFKKQNEEKDHICSFYQISILNFEFCDKKNTSNLFPVPIYFDINREIFLRDIYFKIDTQIRDQIILASPCLFIRL